MAHASTVKVVLNFTDPRLDAEEREEEAQRLRTQLRDLDEVESVERVLDPHPPPDNKAFGGFLAGAIAANVRAVNLTPMLEFLGDRLAQKSVELELEVDGRKLKLKATDQQELISLLPMMQAFVNGQSSGIPIPAAAGSASNTPPVAAIAPKPASPSQPVSVFFSYSHKDEDLRDEMATHLSLLKRQGLISAWHDREISAGSQWGSDIDDHLNSAQVILLLVSANFLASDYCYEVELQRAMERHDRGEACVIPIILKPSDWSSAPFGKLQALPKNAKPITTWDNRDEAFLNVAQGIRDAVQRMTMAPAPTRT